jgi:hypothetical protein
MNRKTIGIALLALAVAAAGAFASGKKEDRDYGPGFYGPGPGGCPGCGYGSGWGMRGRGWQGRGGPRGAWGPWAQDEESGLKFSEDKVSVTGPVYFQNRMHAELKADGKEYELLVPRFYLYELELKEGQQVTVEGYAAQGDDESYLWVSRAVIDGKEYDLERGARGPGWGPGMMGPRRGW